jgi:uncharacterized protein (TIGR02466 family)
MADFINLFTTEVWKIETDKIDNNKLSEIILKQERTKPSRPGTGSSYGGWQGSRDLKNDKRFSNLWEFITQSFFKIAPHYNYKTTISPNINSAWANVNRHSNFNLLHNHARSHWSGCYYVKTSPLCGGIYFKDPRSVRQMVQQPSNLFKNVTNNHAEAEHYAISPTDGLLIMFPSWLEHLVFPNESDEPRVSISFNIVLSEGK